MRTATARQDRISPRLASSRRINDGFRNVVNIVIRVNELLPRPSNDATIFIQREVTRDGAQLNSTLRLAETAKKPRFSDAPPRRRFSIMHSHILPECLAAFSDERDDSRRTAFTRLTIIQRRLYAGNYVPDIPSRSESSLYETQTILPNNPCAYFWEFREMYVQSDRQKVSEKED